MKRVNYFILLILFTCPASVSFSQVMNWGTLKRGDRHIAGIHAGLEYGFVFGYGYAYQFKTRFPLLINMEYSMPAGEKLYDDFKVKTGAEAVLSLGNNFRVSGKVKGVFRRTQNDFTRLLNFGSDMTVTPGFYKKKWFAAAEVGFDKAIVTHFKHSVSYRETYPLVQDGWFDPSTGGHFYYGVMTGFSFKRNDIYIKTGKTLTQDFRENMVPYYGEVGYTVKFGNKNRR